MILRRFVVALLVGGLMSVAGRSFAADGPSVVASIPPVQALVSAVMGDRGRVHLLVGPGQSPHAVTLKPSDARALDAATVVFWVGPDLETFLPKVLGSTSARSVALLEVPGLTLYARRTDPLWAAEDDDHEDEHEHDHSDGAHDPHAWLDPDNARRWVAAIADTLAEIDPDGAPTYRANAVVADAGLKALTAEIEGLLAPVHDRPFMVFHDGYRYIEERFALRGVGAVTVSPSVSPGARHLSALRQRLEAEGVRCLFAEPQFSPRILETLGQGTAAHIATLDPLGGGEGTGLDGYRVMMRTLATAVRDCLATD